MSQGTENYFVSYCKKTSPRKISPEMFTEVSYSFGVHKNCILYDLLRDVMERIIPAGIPQHLWKYEQNYKRQGLKSEAVMDSRRILSLADLEYGFVLWLIAISVSTAVFLIEFLRPKLKIFVGACVGLFYYMKLLRLLLAHHRA
jgi:hypothetical protein